LMQAGKPNNTCCISEMTQDTKHDAFGGECCLPHAQTLT